MTDFESLEQLTEEINKKLFYLDPMHTGSVENELYDEYYRIAEGIAQKVKQGIPIQNAIQNELEFWFGQDDYSAKILSISTALNEAGIDNGKE